MKRVLALTLFSLLVFSGSTFAERINQEGRILGALPVVTNSILFNSNHADTVVSAMQIFPVTNPWNEDISRRPLLTNSDAMITLINSEISPANRGLRVFQEMNYVLIPDSQPKIPIAFFAYADESDLDGGSGTNGTYPISTNMPVETWPSGTGALTLPQWQQDVNNSGGDRHSIIVQPGNGFIWETWLTKLTNGNWRAANGAKFNLNTNGLRPLTWTSGDAAGLPMFPALVRYDECQRGMVEHACRIVVARSRQQFIYPATHWASSTPASQTNVPAMGQRVRLKSNFLIPTNWSGPEQALLLALKKYGALVADNGNFFSISITPDHRWGNAWSHISSISITNFEVIQTTATNGGPRSPGAPNANAGPDQTAPANLVAQLQGSVTYTNTPPLTILWKLYSGPGSVTFGNAAQTNTTATFSAPGVYTLMLSASNGVHAIAYDAVIITVANSINLAIARSNANVSFNWSGGSPPYVLEKTSDLLPAAWSGVLTTSQQNASVPITNTKAFFRVRGN